MKMLWSRLLGFLSICFCLIAVESVEEISINSVAQNADDLLYHFRQAFISSSSSERDLDFSSSQVKYTDQVYGYPNASIENITVTGQTNDYAHSFFGIPYAEPPIGDLRFKPPVRKTIQDDIQASEPTRVVCFQPTSNSDQSEDCLVLNIHVPASVDPESFKTQQFDQLLPVMFWIHGGSFSSGSGTSKEFDGRFLSNSTNTVVVTINYRLGALGFLVFEDEDSTFNGNQGLKDQQLALKFVNDYISNFGGDPNQTTIFGVSAGAQSVMFHLASPISKPYFNRCIMESNPAVFNYPAIGRAKELSGALIGLLDCKKNYASTVECLRNIDPAYIINKTMGVQLLAMSEGDHRSMNEPFRPVVDGVEFPKQPFAMFQEGNWNTDVDVIMGTNRDELGPIKAKFFGKTLPKKIFEILNIGFVGEKLEPLVTSKYSKLVPEGPGVDYAPVIAQEMGDLYFVCPSRLLARFISKTSTSKNNYLYSWNFTSCDNPALPCHYACHACETSYVFNTRGYTGQSNGVEEQAMSAMFSDFWGTFATSGVPTSYSQDKWLKYEELTEKNSVNWKNILMKYPRANMEENYKEDTCDFWDSLNYYAELPANSSGSGGKKSIVATIAAFICLVFFVCF